MLGDRGGRLAVVASICGTDADFQNLEEQRRKLIEAGVYVCSTNRQAADFGSTYRSTEKWRKAVMAEENKLNQLFQEKKLTVINIGVRAFADAVARQPDVEVVQVRWRPIADGDKEMQDILSLLGL